MKVIPKIRYQTKYWWRVICHAFGFCPKCGSRVQRTHYGSVFCTYCGGR